MGEFWWLRQAPEKLVHDQKLIQIVEAKGTANVGRIDRTAFLYFAPKKPEKDFAQCRSCQHFMPDSQRCTLFGLNDVVKADASCALYAHGEPSENQKITSAITPKQGGYIEAEVRCENCSWYKAGRCELFELLDKTLPDVFKLGSAVDAKGCCNAWQK